MHGVVVRGEGEQLVIGGHALVVGEVGEGDLVLGGGEIEAELAGGFGFESGAGHALAEAAPEEAELPDEFTSVEAELIEGADADEALDGLAAEAGALNEVEE